MTKDMPLFIASTESICGACVQQWNGEHYEEILSISDTRVGGKAEAIRIAKHVAAVLNDAPITIDKAAQQAHRAEMKRNAERARRNGWL